MLRFVALVWAASLQISWVTVEAWISFPARRQLATRWPSPSTHCHTFFEKRFTRNDPRTVGFFSQNSNHDDNIVGGDTSLSQCVCLVTGASRGIGKGIALELGRCGATVYVTGTTTIDDRKPRGTEDASSPPGTVQDTAREVTQAGGHGIAVVCNHADDAQVQQLVQQIQRQHGRLDILVNNAFRLPNDGAAVEQLQQKFWQLGADAWDSLHTVGLRSHYMTTVLAMPLLFQAREYDGKGDGTTRSIPRPLIVMIGSFGGITYMFNVPYGVGKAGVDRMAKDMAVELLEEDICVLSLWPGVVNTERTQIAVENGTWEKYIKVPLENAESPQFTGRAVVALAQDRNNLRKTGTYQVVAELASEYGFTDITGLTPPSIRSLKFLLPGYAFDKKMRERVPDWLIPDWKLPFWMMSQGPPPESKA